MNDDWYIEEVAITTKIKPPYTPKEGLSGYFNKKEAINTRMTLSNNQ